MVFATISGPWDWQRSHKAISMGLPDCGVSLENYQRAYVMQDV